MNMKSLNIRTGSFLTTGALSILMLLGSCDKKEVETTDQDAKLRAADTRVVPEDLAYVGIEHNAQTDALYDAYVADGVTEDESKEYARTFLIGQIDWTDPEIGELAEENINDYFDNPIASYSDDFYPGSLETDLDSAIKGYLDDLHGIMSIDGITVSDLNAQVTDLETTIYGDMSLNNDELCVLFSATQTAKHSYEYWTNNGDKWMSLDGGAGFDGAAAVEDGAGEATASAVAGDIAKADVGGAVGAAAGAWVVNVAPGAGQVAYGGAILGGAVGTSVGAGVVKLLDWIW